MPATQLTNPITKLLTAKTAAGRSEVFSNPYQSSQTFGASVAGTGAVAAQVKIYGSNNVEVLDGKDRWVLLATIDLSGTTSASDGYYQPAIWKFYQAELVSISGTNAAADVQVGV